MAGAKRVPVAIAAASKPGLRPRTALGDIGNKVSEQAQARVPLKKVTIFLAPAIVKEPVFQLSPLGKHSVFSILSTGTKNFSYWESFS